MQTGVGEPRIGQWYRHFDKGQIFQVTGLDQPSRTIEIQGFDGDLDEIDQEVWAGLPLGLAEAPEDWTGPVDVTGDELDGQGSEMNAADWWISCSLVRIWSCGRIRGLPRSATRRAIRKRDSRSSSIYRRLPHGWLDRLTASAIVNAAGQLAFRRKPGSR